MKLTPDLENMGFCLINVNETDVDNYIYLKRTVYKKYIDEHSDFFGEWNDKFSFDEFYHKIKLTFFKKLLLNDAIVGFMNYDQKKDKIDDTSIFLAEKVQNKGIGTLFISNLIKLSKEYSIPTFIEVITTNPAQNLYKRLGFEIYKEKDVFYFLKYIP